MDLNTICCICLERTKTSIHNLPRYVNETCYLKLITTIPEMRCAQITESSAMCEECCKTIDNLYEFRKKCLRNKEILINSTTIHNEKDPIHTNLIHDDFQNEPTIPENLYIKTEYLDQNIDISSDSTNSNYVINLDETPIKIEIVEHDISKEETDQNVSKDFDNPTLLRPISIKNPLKCSECNAEFSEKSTLIHHMLVHSWESVYECTSCDKLFKNKSSLDYHEPKHRSKENFQCSLCKKWFKYKRNLTAHMKLHLRETGPSGKPKSSQKSTHQKNDKSLDSNNSFSITSLNDNLKTHKVGNYRCTVCDVVFFSRPLFTEHMVTHGKKPHVCLVCKKSFTHVSLLRRHGRKHTGLNVYECTSCGMSFNYKTNYMNHLKDHENTMDRLRKIGSNTNGCNSESNKDKILKM